MMVIDGYTVDAEIVGAPQYENDVTDFPVEEGADLNDNVRKKSLVLNVEGIVTDTPLGTLVQDREIESLVLGGKPRNNAHARFLELHDRASTGVTCSVQTSLDSYENMILMTYAPKREGNAIRFTMTFKQIRWSSNERVTVAVKSTLPRAGKQVVDKKNVTELKDSRGRAIFKTTPQLDPTNQFFAETSENLTGNKGVFTPRPVYQTADGKPVPDKDIDKAVRDVGGVRGQYNPDGSFTYHNTTTPSSPPWWLDDDKVYR